MTHPRRLFAVVGLGWLMSFGALGCNAILGISEDPVVVSSSAKSCLLKSECGDASSTDAIAGGACSPDGALRCEGNAEAARSICQGGKWTTTDSCPDGMLCDSSSMPAATCSKIEPTCVGHQPNDSFCAGSARIVCGPDLVSAQTTQCKTSAYCTSVETGCAPCLDNEFMCDTNKLMRCKADHSAFELSKTCGDPNVPCSAQAGDCTTHACSPMQKRCNGDMLEQCNADQSAFALLETCGAGLCDSQALQCDKCVAKAATCASGMVRTCSDDGQTQVDKPCPTVSPFCIGNGTCVACLASTSCATTNAPICDPTLFTCRGCKPGSPPTAGDAECNTRYGAIAPACISTGACARCSATNATQCAATTPLCDTTNGTCAQCLGSSSCTGAKPICSGGVCSACTNDAQCTAKANGLNGCLVGSGTCVPCVSSANCAGSNVCQANNTCCTPEAKAVTCGSSTCGGKLNNCGVTANCGTCPIGKNCCTNAANLGVYTCVSIACE